MTTAQASTPKQLRNKQQLFPLVAGELWRRRFDGRTKTTVGSALRRGREVADAFPLPPSAVDPLPMMELPPDSPAVPVLELPPMVVPVPVAPRVLSHHPQFRRSGVHMEPTSGVPDQSFGSRVSKSIARPSMEAGSKLIIEYRATICGTL